LIETINGGNKVMVCGNGGSAADSQHFAAEIIGRFENDRIALPAIALTTDTSALTAIANDYGYEFIFSRQVEGMGNIGDALVGISTSGNSENIINAVESAKEKKMKTIGLLGQNGGKLSAIVNYPVIIPHDITARIQEAHIFIIHFWCALIEKQISRNR
jgi:D-sedoheptulose 7-phosphate isomerase